MRGGDARRFTILRRLVVRVEVWKPKAVTTNCKPFSHGDLELLCIVLNEVHGVTMAVKKRVSVLNVRWAMESDVMSSPGTFDSGLTHPGECFKDRVERMPEPVSIRPDTEQENVDDYIPEVGLERPEESVVVCHGVETNEAVTNAVEDNFIMDYRVECYVGAVTIWL